MHLNKPKLLLMITICLFANSLWASNIRVPIKLSPLWVTSVVVNINDSLKVCDVSDGYLYLLLDRQVNTEKQQSYSHEIRKIISDEGVQNGSELSIDFDPSYEKLSLHSVKVIRNGQIFDRTKDVEFKIIQPESRLSDHIFVGELTAVAFLNDIRKGDIIEYSYSFEGFNKVFESKFSKFIYYQSSSPISKFYFKLILPLGKDLKIKNDKNLNEVKINTIGQSREYVWMIEHIQALKIEDNIPDWYDAYESIQVSEYKTWEELQIWANHLFYNEEPISNAIKNKVNELKIINATKEQQLIAALQFVQNEVRYVGIETGEYSHKPESPNKIFNQRYGDCKGKTVLLCLLLNQLGIEAYPALVNSYYRESIANFLPAPEDFNHCIAKVKFNNHNYWLDPTISYQHGSLENHYCPLYGKALVVNDNSKGLSDVVTVSQGFTKVIEVFVIKDTINPVQLDVYTDYFGRDADFFRSNFASSGRTNLEDNFLKFYESKFPEIASLKPIEIFDDTLKNKINTVEKYQIKNLWERTDSSSNKIEAYFYADIIRSLIHDPSTNKRVTPFALNHPKNFEEDIKLVLWEKWDIKEKQKRIKNKWIDFFYKYSLNGDTIILNYSYKTLQDHVLPNEISSYSKDVQKIYDNSTYGISWNSDALHPKKDINFLMVIVALLFIGVLILISRKVYRISLTNNSNEESMAIGGWLILIMIGLIFTPFRVIYQISSMPYFDQTTWTLLTSISSESYNPLWATTITFELIGNLLTGTTAIFCLILMVKKRDIFPRVMIFYLVSNFLIVLLDHFLAKLLPTSNETVKEVQSNNSEIFRSFIASAIWIPFMLRSKTVKETFKRPYFINSNQTLPELNKISNGSTEESSETNCE